MTLAFSTSTFDLMETKKTSHISVLKSKGRKVAYIANAGNVQSDREKEFCEDNLLKHVIRDKKTQRDIDIIVTRRETDGTFGKIVLDSYIFIYDDHITNAERNWICIMCVEKIHRQNCRDYSNRIYCLGFIERSKILSFCGPKMHPNDNLTINGAKPELPFYTMRISILLDTIPASGCSENEPVPIPEPIDNDIIAKREACSLYVFIMHWTPPTTSHIHDMTNLEQECIDRIKMLWFMRQQNSEEEARQSKISEENPNTKKRVTPEDGSHEEPQKKRLKSHDAYVLDIKERMMDIDNWYRDMRTIHALLLVMCWDSKWMEWYIESEREYVLTICKNMIDIDDLIINLGYNRLQGVIKITGSHCDTKEIARQFADLHVHRISVYMKKWIKERKNSQEMPVVMVRFMGKITKLLESLHPSDVL